MAGQIIKTSGKTNCTFSYGRSSKAYALQTRVRGISHSWEVIATESHARRTRAFYPHQRAVGPFTLTLELKGYAELNQVMDWMRGYIDSSMDVNQNSITVSVPAMNFWRLGVPVGGVMDMDRTGSNVFLPTVTFEAIMDPIDPTTFTGTGNSVSQVDYGFTQRDDASKFFYPGTIAVNDPNATGDSFYDNPNPNDPSTIGNPDTNLGPDKGYTPPRTGVPVPF